VFVLASIFSISRTSRDLTSGLGGARTRVENDFIVLYGLEGVCCLQFLGPHREFQFTFQQEWNRRVGVWSGPATFVN
jgi:hypothetical protein